MGQNLQNRIFFFPIEGESESVRVRADRRPRSDFRVHVHAGPGRDHGLRAGGHRIGPPAQDEGEYNLTHLVVRVKLFVVVPKQGLKLSIFISYFQMTKLRVVEPTTDLTRVSEGIAQLEIMLNDVIKVSAERSNLSWSHDFM